MRTPVWIRSTSRSLDLDLDASKVVLRIVSGTNVPRYIRMITRGSCAPGGTTGIRRAPGAMLVRAGACAHASALGAARPSAAAPREFTNTTVIGGVIMKQFLASLMFGTLFAVGGAVIAAGMAADPVIGTWKLDLAKSMFGAGPAVKAQTRTYSQSAQGITLNMKTCLLYTSPSPRD